MRTNIEIDLALMLEAQQLSQIKTKKALVHQALLEFVSNRKRLDKRELHRSERLDLMELRGSNLIDDDYDHKAMR